MSQAPFGAAREAVPGEALANASNDRVVEADVVVGAEPGGSATATHLARRGRKVALLEKSESLRDAHCSEGGVMDHIINSASRLAPSA